VGALSLYLNFNDLFMLMLRLTTPSAGASNLFACK
jgi:FtsH-binding integral membrane protein